jgi:hypothetical protein
MIKKPSITSTLLLGNYDTDILLVLLTFTLLASSLTKIYTGLCECCAKPMKSCERPKLGRSQEDNQAALTNRYAVLGLNASDNETHSTDKPPYQRCDECERENRAATAKLKATPRLVGDHLGNAFDLGRAIQVCSCSSLR